MLHDLTLSLRRRARNFPAVLRAAIFDFDETMIDLEPQHAFASEALCREMGSDYASLPEEWRLGSGRRVLDDVRDLRAHFGWRESVEELFASRQRFFDEACATARLELMPGVERVVRGLHESGVRLAITSSAVRSGIVAILRRFDLERLFALIVDGSEVTHGKPHPEAYELTAQRLGIPKDESIVFEDSTVGVAAAKAAGMFCIGVRNPRALTSQDLAAADVVIDSFEDLVERE